MADYALPVAEEALMKIRASLADMGYNPEHATLDTIPGSADITIYFKATIPYAIGYMATYLLQLGDLACWSCAMGGDGELCHSGECRNPDGPRVPPRALLVRGDA